MSEKNKFLIWWNENSWPTLAFLISRVGLLLLVYLSLIVIPTRTGDGLWRAFPQNLFLDGWSRWDSGWYVNIAQSGYSSSLQNVYLNTAFFPLYPILIKGLAVLVGNYHLAGLLISNLALLGTCLLLYRIITNRFETEIAQKSLLLLLLCPFSFFFSAVYTESLFLLLVVMVFYFGEQKKWLVASLFAAAAGATRLVGILTVIPLFFIYLESIGYQWKNMRANILWLLLCVLGPGSYMLFQGIQFGDPFLFVKSQNAPGWQQGVNLFSALDALRVSFSWPAIKTGEIRVVYLVHILVFILGLSLTIIIRRKMPFSWWIWTFITLLVSFSVWISVGRFMIVLFPLYVGTAITFKNKSFDALLYGSTLLLALFSILFSHWYWIG